jgi:c-di-GMP phosphodiesterase
MLTASLLVDSKQQLIDQLSSVTVVQDQTTLIQLFSALPQDDVVDIAQKLLDHIPGAVVIGMSCEQVIEKGENYVNKTLVLISQFAQTTLTSAISFFGDSTEQSSNTLIDHLHIGKGNTIAICFADRLDITDRAHFSLFDHIPSSLTIAGGVSCNTHNGRWVLLGDTIYQHAFVGVALHSNVLHYETDGFTEWSPIGKTFEVTEMKNDCLYQLDNRPVKEVYRRYLGDGSDVPFDLLINFPFVVGDPAIQNVFVPINQTIDEGIAFDRRLKLGDKVRFCYDHPSLSIEQVCLRAKLLAASKPDQIFIYNCMSRLNFIEGNQEIQPLQNVANVYGVYCMGEFARHGSEQRVLHHSMTFLAMSEGVSSFPRFQARSDFTNLGSVAPLFSLIRNSFDDLDEMAQDMAHKIELQATQLMKSYRVDRATGLPNRVVLRERLETLANNEHLLTLKLTNFNQINNKYGYLVGDKLLLDLTKHFLAVMQEQLEGRCTLYSIGVGQWATVFRTDFDSTRIHAFFSAFVDELENVNFEPFGLPDLDYLSISVCAGLVSRRDFPDYSIDDLLIKSVEARRLALQNNKHFYNASHLRQQEDQRHEQLMWLSCVSRAILDDKVLIYSQPIVEARTHQLSSYECLVRIEQDGEIILPGNFLPIIEDTHLYTRLSRQVIKRTFEAMKNRTESFSINLAPQDFMSERTLEYLEAAIKSMPNPERVGLEVLETEQIKDYVHMIDVCNQFRALGASIIVDDFGSGYSNIDEIIKLEPQVIKIDGSLIRNIDRDSKQLKIARQLVQLCHVLNAKTVAEFVHNEQICKLVEDMGIDYLQGFYFGEPQRLT